MRGERDDVDDDADADNDADDERDAASRLGRHAAAAGRRHAAAAAAVGRRRRQTVRVAAPQRHDHSPVEADQCDGRHHVLAADEQTDAIDDVVCVAVEQRGRHETDVSAVELSARTQRARLISSETN